MSDLRALRIGIDARELLGAPTGVGRYLAELIDRWQRREDHTRPRLLLYVPASDRAAGVTLRSMAALPDIEVREVAGDGGTWWEQRRLARAVTRDRPDVFFAPAYSAPLALTTPVVLVVHDVSFFAHPEWFRWPHGARRRMLTRWSARKAAHIVTVSRFSAGEITRYLEVPPSKVAVVHHGLPPRERFGVPPAPVGDREPLVLFAGSLFNRRHVPDLLRAFVLVARAVPSARLVLAGENRTQPREDPAALARELGLGERVTVRSYVTDRELGELYARASVFAFLSEYEGFGFTPLEAVSMGVPAVVYDTPVSREAYGDAVTAVAPGDVSAVASALVGLLADPAAREASLSGAGAVLARYSWDRAAAETLAILARCSGRGGPA